jgi:hypothetical protein
VSEAGFEGAGTLFKQVTTIAGDMGIGCIPSVAEQSASARSAVDAYMSAKNGVAPGTEAFQNGQMPNDFPKVDLKAEAGLDSSKMAELGKAVSELMTQMGDMFNQMVSGPMGIIGNLLNFLLKVFSEIVEGVGQALAEAANAIASVLEDAWKKQMELASTATSQAGLQPLELYNQAATTQTLSLALKTASSTST